VPPIELDCLGPTRSAVDEKVENSGDCVIEFAVPTWATGFNARRLQETLGFVPPAEHEARHYAHTKVA
jgi:hypothetical protein